MLHHSEERLGRRLVLLALADNAHDDGTGAHPTVETIASKARLSEREVQYCLRGLTSDGSLMLTGKTDKGVNTYTVVMGPPTPPQEGANLAGANLAPEGAAHCTPGVQPIAPEPSFNQRLKTTPPVGGVRTTNGGNPHKPTAAVGAEEDQGQLFDTPVPPGGKALRAKAAAAAAVPPPGTARDLTSGYVAYHVVQGLPEPGPPVRKQYAGIVSKLLDEYDAVVVALATMRMVDKGLAPPTLRTFAHEVGQQQAAGTLAMPAHHAAHLPEDFGALPGFGAYVQDFFDRTEVPQ